MNQASRGPKRRRATVLHGVDASVGHVTFVWPFLHSSVVGIGRNKYSQRFRTRLQLRCLGIALANCQGMSSASFLPDPATSASCQETTIGPRSTSFRHAAVADTPGLLQSLARRWRRERRRRKVGRAYDMALEIARILPRGSRVLDVGCGNGYIAHHLTAMLNAGVVGTDLNQTTEALIDYRSFNGTDFPVDAQSFDGVLLCYVLHHAQNLDLVLRELRRVLRDGGRAVVYEDVPENGWDRLICAIHNRKWRNRTGNCTFHVAPEWRKLFKSAGFEVVDERRLSRWRNLTHPVSRSLYVLSPK
jgi:ubiquinone/menaquinone biosynthesis C-methylase UbiE